MRMLLMLISPIWMPLSRFLRSFMTNSRNRLKRLGDNRHHCLTPVTTWNQSVICPFITTAHSVCLYMFSMRSTIVLGLLQRSVGISRVLSRDGVECGFEINKVPVEFYPSFTSLRNDLSNDNTASAVPLELRNPHCSSVRWLTGCLWLPASY